MILARQRNDIAARMSWECFGRSEKKPDQTPVRKPMNIGAIKYGRGLQAKRMIILFFAAFVFQAYFSGDGALADASTVPEVLIDAASL